MNEATVRALIRRFAAAGLPDGDYGDISISGGGTVVSIDANAVGTTEIADGAVTFAKLAGAAVITSGEVLRSNDNDTSVPASAAVIDALGPQLQTAQTATGSNTVFDFTGIPAWVNRITITPAGLSTNGTSVIIVQIGDSGGIETTAYVSTSVNTSVTALGHTSATAGFILTAPTAATDIASGGMVLNRVSGNLWTASSTVKRNTTAMCIAAGDKTLSDVLDRVRITTVGGTDTFDAGSVSISWE